MFSDLLTPLSAICVFLPLVTPIKVSTKYGDIEGVVASTSYPSVSGLPFQSVRKFLGVPFAAPPVGELRLKPPVHPVVWRPNVLSAKKHGNICMQSREYDTWYKTFSANYSYSEDCLYLDVYTPNVSTSLPVMVYIHGGSFTNGATITYPSDILALHGVVVVVIQYRLGPFGFLTTGDSSAPGNFAMLDQVEALKWVRDNIASFGGDSNKVTIFGESAGAASVSLHLLSPLSEGLFHQAIVESGVDLSSFATQPVSFGLHYAEELAKKLQCTTTSYNKMVSCIRSKSAMEMQDAAEMLTFKLKNYLMWAPVVDNHFLLSEPRDLREKGEFTKVKFMIGFMSHEGASYLEPIAKWTFGLNENVEDGVSPAFFKKFLTAFARVGITEKKNADLIAGALEFMYTPWPDNSEKFALRSQLVDSIGDSVFVAPSHEVADIHSQYAEVYMYEFAHRSKNSSYYAEWMGVAHGENLPFDFGIPVLPNFPEYDAADRNVSLFVMAVYANFANFGNPTPQPVSGVMWEKYNSSHRAYLHMNTKSKMAASFAPRRMSFWNNYHPKLKEVNFDLKSSIVSAVSSNAALATYLLLGVIISVTIF